MDQRFMRRVVIGFFVAGCVTLVVAPVEAVTTYDSSGFGRVTVLSWTDETMQNTFDPKPPDLTVTPEDSVDIDDVTGSGGPSDSSADFDANAGDVGSRFSYTAQTTGGIDPSSSVLAQSELLGSAELMIDNDNPIEMLVDVQLDWEVAAAAFTDSPGSEFGFAAASIGFAAYSGFFEVATVTSDTRNGDGLVELSGTDFFTVRIPSQDMMDGLDEIRVEINVFGQAAPIPGGNGVPEPATATLGVVGLLSMGWATGRRRGQQQR